MSPDQLNLVTKLFHLSFHAQGVHSSILYEKLQFRVISPWIPAQRLIAGRASSLELNAIIGQVSPQLI